MDRGAFQIERAAYLKDLSGKKRGMFESGKDQNGKKLGSKSGQEPCYVGPHRS